MPSGNRHQSHGKRPGNDDNCEFVQGHLDILKNGGYLPASDDSPIPTDDLPKPLEHRWTQSDRDLFAHFDMRNYWHLRAYSHREMHSRECAIRYIMLGTFDRSEEYFQNMPVLLAAIMSSMPFAQLRSLHRRVRFYPKPHSFDTVKFMVNVGELAKIYFQNAVNQPTMSHSGIICLDAAERNCTLTGAKGAQVSYIFPATANRTRASMDLLQKYGLELAILTNGHHDFLLKKPDCADNLWNMLPLDPVLHKWWARGYFGLRYKETKTVYDLSRREEEEEDCTDDFFEEEIREKAFNVTMVLQWLPRQKKPRGEEDKEEGEKKKGRKPPTPIKRTKDGHIALDEIDLRSWKEAWGGQKYDVPANERHLEGMHDDDVQIVKAHEATWERLRSGTEYTVRFNSREDARNMQAMLELQWTLQQVASMCDATLDQWYVGLNPVQGSEGDKNKNM